MDNTANNEVSQLHVPPKEFWEAVEVVYEYECKPLLEMEDRGYDIDERYGKERVDAYLVLYRWLRIAYENKWLARVD